MGGSNRTVHRQDNLLGNGKTQAAAAGNVGTGSIGTVKAVKQFGKAFFRHALSRIGTVNGHAVRFLCHGYRKINSICRFVFQAVAQQIFQYAAKLHAVDGNLGLGRFADKMQRHALFCHQRGFFLDKIFKITIT